MPELKRALTAADAAAVRQALTEDGAYRVQVDGEVFDVGPDDVEVRATSHEELALAQEGRTAVALDTVLDDELRLEGVAREVVRALNDLRKAAGFEIADRIDVLLLAEGTAHDALDRYRDWISAEVLAKRLSLDSSTALRAQGYEEIKVGNESVWARLQKV
jgi:isoleucyl-tRNA synthetase